MFTSKRSNAARDRAAHVRAHLANNGRLRPMALPTDIAQLGQEADEYAVALFTGGMTYQRWSAAAVEYVRGGSVVVGSAPYVAGFVLGATVSSARQKSRARRMAEPQWRGTALRRLVVTTHRLWCEVWDNSGVAWRRFNFETIAALESTDDAMTMWFQDSEPLRLSGEWAPWCAAVIDHFRRARVVSLPGGNPVLVSN